MNEITSLFSNLIFVSAFWGWLSAQVLKVILTLIFDREFQVGRFIGSGGMPSSHSSLVMAITTALGIKYGIGSDAFAVSLSISLIIMYDASGVRRAVGTHASILNTLIKDLTNHKPVEYEKLKELIGHTPLEVLCGAILGIIVGNIIM
jgi:acid phosphatase family membrane protein YuiD